MKKPIYDLKQKLTFTEMINIKVNFISQEEDGSIFYSENGDDYFSEETLSPVKDEQKAKSM